MKSRIIVVSLLSLACVGAAATVAAGLSGAPDAPVEAPGTSTQLIALLSGDYPGVGKARFTDAKGTKELFVVIAGGKPKDVLSVSVDGIAVGSMRLDEGGAGRLQWSSVGTRPVPPVKLGSVIRVGPMAGKFTESR